MTAPGDCLAFALYRQSKETEAESILNKALECTTSPPWWEQACWVFPPPWSTWAVEDEYIIIGSANINERSMNGARDSRRKVETESLKSQLICASAQWRVGSSRRFTMATFVKAFKRSSVTDKMGDAHMRRWEPMPRSSRELHFRRQAETTTKDYLM